MRTDRSLYRIFLRKSTDFLRRIIVPVEGQGGVTLSYVCPHCHRSRSKTTFGGFRLGTERSGAACGVRLSAASTIGILLTELWSHKTARTAEMQRCFEHSLHRKRCVTTGSMRSRSGQTSSKTATAQSRWSHKACKKEAGSE